MAQGRIALIHALEDSVEPARAAFAALWPEAHAFDLLDTSLATDRAFAGRLDAAMIERFVTLGRYAAGTTGQGGRTSGILFTCSAFGPAIDRVKVDLSIPVLRPNEAAFAEALRVGRRLGLVVSFEPSRAALEAELHAMAADEGRSVEIRTVLAEGALAALKRDDAAAHDHSVAEAAKSLGAVDAVILGQFSLARARSEVAARCECPVVTTPHSAITALRAMVSSGP